MAILMAVYTNINVQGKQEYDQANLSYDDSSVFYDSVDIGAYTFIGNQQIQDVGVILNGTSQYLSHINQSALQITGDMTIECSVVLSSQPATGKFFGLLTKHDTPTDISYSFRYGDTSGTKKLSLRISSDGNPGVTKNVDYTLPIGTLVHLSIVYTASSGTAKFYVNGIQQGATQTGFPVSIFTSSSGLFIGQETPTGGDNEHYFSGVMSQVRLWSIARTQSQIQSTMESSVRNDEMGLNGYWQLNSTLADSTSNGNTLTNNGGAAFYSPYINVAKPTGGFFITAGMATGLIMPPTYSQDILAGDPYTYISKPTT